MSVLEPYWADDQITLHLGDCVDVLAGMDAASVDAIVTDPPYGLEFMGREWDSADGFRRSLNPADTGRDNVFGRHSARGPEYTTGAGRRGKPGIGDRPTDWVSNQGWNGFRCRGCGHLSHGGSPCECDEPDFARADGRWNLFQEWCEQWATACLRVLKPGGFMLAFGGTRTWHRLACGIEDAGFEIRDSTSDLTGFDGPGLAWAYGQGMPKNQDAGRAVDMHVCVLPGRHCMRKLPAQPRPDDHVCPESPEGDAWRGWGTAWKPSWEPVVCGRKPLAGTLAANLLRYGVGAVNIAGTRLPPTGESRERAGEPSQDRRYTEHGGTDFAVLPGVRGGDPDGRWPPNMLLGQEAAAELDRQSGTLTSGANPTRRASDKFRDVYGDFAGQAECKPHRGADSGGASRFFPVFYHAKATNSERPQLEDGTSWPTVKPLPLVRHLCRSVTPPGGLILDLFAGTGPTAEACIVEGFRCVLIDKDPVAAELIRTRLRKDIQPDMFGGAA